MSTFHLKYTNKAQVVSDLRPWTHTCKHCRGSSFRWYPDSGPCGRGGWSCVRGTPWDSLKEKTGSKASPQHWRRPGRSLSTLPPPERTVVAWSPAGWRTRAGSGTNNAAASSDSNRSAESNTLFCIIEYITERLYIHINNSNPHMTCGEKKLNIDLTQINRGTELIQHGYYITITREQLNTKSWKILYSRPWCLRFNLACHVQGSEYKKTRNAQI